MTGDFELNYGIGSDFMLNRIGKVKGCDASKAG